MVRAARRAEGFGRPCGGQPALRCRRRNGGPAGGSLPLGATPGLGRRPERARGARGDRERGAGLVGSSVPLLSPRSRPISPVPPRPWRCRPVSATSPSATTWPAGSEYSSPGRAIGSAADGDTGDRRVGGPPTRRGHRSCRERPSRRRHNRLCRPTRSTGWRPTLSIPGLPTGSSP